MSHIKEQQKLFNKNKATIMALLGWSELDYGNFQYNTGIRYLEENFELDEASIDFLVRQRIFWQWWINEWNLRDEREYLPLVANSPVPWKVYMTIHNPRDIKRRPADIVLSETYAVMVGQLNDELKAKKS